MALRSERGRAAERLALDYLRRRGLRLREANYRCRAGEIDLVMSDGDSLVFVEVRQRSNPRFGGAAASVDAVKQRKLIATARHYLQAHGADSPARFDVVAIDATGTPQWIRDAFAADAD
ncbi:YraN family protein [Acidihalobacter prosperus]